MRLAGSLIGLSGLVAVASAPLAMANVPWLGDHPPEPETRWSWGLTLAVGAIAGGVLVLVGFLRRRRLVRSLHQRSPVRAVARAQRLVRAQAARGRGLARELIDERRAEARRD